jgi:hypothetical protein
VFICVHPWFNSAFSPANFLFFTCFPVIFPDLLNS